MDLTERFFTAFTVLDAVLAVFGALIVSLWFGRGKKLSGLLTGAAVGGLIRPVLTVILLALAVSTAAPDYGDRDSKATDAYVKMLGQ